MHDGVSVGWVQCSRDVSPVLPRTCLYLMPPSAIRPSLYPPRRTPSLIHFQAVLLGIRHQDMSKQRDWRHELEKMKIGNVVGTLFVESKTLKHSLVPVTQVS